jgi:hypothetical protein
VNTSGATQGIPSAFAAYVDDQNVPQLTVSCVVYWDVLGVTAFSEGPDALAHLRALTVALEKARERAAFESEEAEPYRAVTWFTDNVVIGSPISGTTGPHGIEPALGYSAVGAAYLQLLLLDAGYIGRGAIAVGPHHMQKRMAFGPALIEAVKLKKATRWPRVALTPQAADFNRTIVTEFYAAPEDSPHATEYLVDEDDVVFVDHLSVWLGDEDDVVMAERLLTRQRTVIGDSLSRGTGEVLEKWKWLADMHNHVLSQVPEYEKFRIAAGETRHTFRSFIDTI